MSSFKREALSVVVPNSPALPIELGTGLTPKMRIASIGSRQMEGGAGAATSAAVAVAGATGAGMRSALQLSSPRSSYRGLRPAPSHHAHSRRRLNPPAGRATAKTSHNSNGGGGDGDGGDDGSNDGTLQCVQLQQCPARSGEEPEEDGGPAGFAAIHTPRDGAAETEDLGAGGGCGGGSVGRQQALRFRADTAELPFARELAEAEAEAAQESGAGALRAATCPPTIGGGCRQNGGESDEGQDDSAAARTCHQLPALQRSESPEMLRKRSRAIGRLERPRPASASSSSSSSSPSLRSSSASSLTATLGFEPHHASRIDDDNDEASFLSSALPRATAASATAATAKAGGGCSAEVAAPAQRSLSVPVGDDMLAPPMAADPVLPTVPSPKHPDLHVITPATLAKLLRGEFAGAGALTGHTVIDCRFKFEHEGGHIRGAKLLNDPCANAELLMRRPMADSATHALIFHCEFSQNRAPKMVRHLRNLDRNLHQTTYPQLHYPQMYLLEGGYKKFFAEEPDCCEPRSYCPMDREGHEEECRRSFKDLRTSMRRSKEAGTRGLCGGNPLRNSAPS